MLKMLKITKNQKIAKNQQNAKNCQKILKFANNYQKMIKITKRITKKQKNRQK